MIYWFTGQPSSGKTTLGNKLYKFLKTEKRNWREGSSIKTDRYL